jgi:hypothetical protein
MPEATMLSASSILRCSLLIGAAAIPILGACATSTMDPNEGTSCVGAACLDAASSGNKPDGHAGTKDGTGGGTTTDATSGADDSGGSADDSGEPPLDGASLDSASLDSASLDTGIHAGDAGNWVDMTANATGCDNRDGTLCGWSATNNGLGYTCACRHGEWQDGWTCDAKNAPTTAGASCPGVVTTDAGTNEAGAAPDSGGVVDSGGMVDSGGNTDAGGGWVDMSNAPHACDNKPDTPCGWNPTKNNTTYTCACRRGDWADGWTCDLITSTKTAGPSCP